MRSDQLFSQVDSFSFFEQQKREMVAEIEQANLSRSLAGGDIAAMTDDFVGRYMPHLPVLHPENKTYDTEEIDIDISGDPQRLFFHTGIGRPVVRGTRINIYVPFDGEPTLFYVLPSTFNTNPPRADIESNTLVFRYEDTQIDDSKLKIALESWLKDVQQYLTWHEKGLGENRRKLVGAAQQALHQKLAQQQAAQGALQGLGIPRAKSREGSAAPTPLPTTHAGRSAKTVARTEFDCFVSYAGEDRAIVEGLVSALQERGVDVWWDKAQIKLGDSLMRKIEEGLTRSRYGLVIVGPSFIAKRWPENELRALHNRAMSSGKKVLLPVLVDMTHDKFAAAYPLLADIVSTTFNGDIAALVDEIIEAMD
jgi:hypothetical protein